MPNESAIPRRPSSPAAHDSWRLRLARGQSIHDPPTVLAIGGLGTPELLVIAVVIFLLFGATRLPQLAKSLGQSKRAFKEGLDEGAKEDEKEAKEK